ncbi:MAG: S1/P1 nuclease [Tenacibaculum sp.]
MTKYCITLIISLLLSFYGLAIDVDWGSTGHRVTGKIAAKYLSKKAKRKVRKLLKDESLAFVSTYADEIKSDKKYRAFYVWHFVNMPLNGNYEDSEKNPKGDLLSGIEYCIEVLKNKNSLDKDKRFYLKMLVHLIGDLHQPLHLGRKEDKGGNSIEVQWHGKKTNLHSVWDEAILSKWNMSYTELANSFPCLSKQQIKNINKGNISDWVEESHKLTTKIYQSIEQSKNLSYWYSYIYFPLVRKQLQKGGLRLAKLLNSIFC